MDIFTKKYFVCYTKEIKYEIYKNGKEYTTTKFNCSVSSKDLETAMKKKEEREQKYNTPNFIVETIGLDFFRRNKVVLEYSEGLKRNNNYEKE